MDHVNASVRDAPDIFFFPTQSLPGRTRDGPVFIHNKSSGNRDGSGATVSITPGW